MSDSKYTMTEEEIKEQGIAEEAEDAITDENYAEASEKNIWDGEKMVTEAQYIKDVMAAYHAQKKED